MWFRKLRLHQDSKARGGVVAAPRRSPKFGPRFVEALEDRALMSMGGDHIPLPLHTSFTQTNLVSDGKVSAAHVDTNLVNPWGIAFSPTSPFWVADNGKGVSTVYDGSGNPQPTPKSPLVVTIPPPKDSMPPSAPTGIVFNGTSDFVVSSKVDNKSESGASVFIFATEDGTISGWNPTVGVPAGSNPPSTQAILAVDNSGSGAVYKGLAMASNHGANYLYATNFHDGTIDVFDKDFHPHTFFAGQLTDPKSPAGYAPFGIQNIDGKLYVTYAKQDADKHDDVGGPGNGFVDVFNPNGHFLKRFATGTDVGGKLTQLNSPWGLTLAPAGFFSGGQDHGEEGQDREHNGQSSHVLLIGNFGDSHVNAFDLRTGKFLGQLTGTDGKPLVLNGGFVNSSNPSDTKGLWGLRFGNGGKAGDPNTLFFTAGINDEADGLFGSVTPVSM
jgi:uncharacterized protein (TIGR03118 family)